MKPCDGCAYTEGAEANLEPQNSIKAQLCLLGAIPFFCHHDADGAVRDLSDIKRSQLREEIQAGRVLICQGWRREVAALAATGYFKQALEAKRAFAILGIGALQIFVTTDDEEKKRQASRTLRDVIIALNKERGYTEVEDNDHRCEELT